MSELAQEYNILEGEFNPTVFTLILLAAYLDFKSHYPNQKITRNASVQTLLGVIIALLEPDAKTAYLTVPGFYDIPNTIPHFGGLLLTMVNDDPIAYAAIGGNLPSISELSKRLVKYDSEPIFEPINKVIQTEFKKPSKLNNFLSFMSSLNRKKIPKEAESDVELKDNKFFLTTSGKMVYYGTLVEYRYNSRNVIDYATEHNQFNIFNTDSMYGYTQKDSLLIDNNFLTKPSRERYQINKPFEDFPLEEFHKLVKASIFTDKIYLEGERFDLLDRNFYYPFFRFIDQLEGRVNPNKDTVISYPQYRMVVLKHTAYLDFRYSIKYKDLIDLEILQSMQLLRRNAS